MILEKEEREAGFADSFIYTDSSRQHVMELPACGFSNMYDPLIPMEDKRIYWSTEHDGANGFLLAKQSIELLLQRNQLTKKDIKYYFLSQLSKKNIQRVQTELGEPIEKFIFIGNEFGYTGTSSPFIALHHAVENNIIDRGDWIMLWSVGVGYISCCVLMKF
jgi:3-oxoacyl-[acyl-carrier-protein] synthase-3